MIKHSGKQPMRRRNSCSALHSGSYYHEELSSNISCRNSVLPPVSRIRRLSMKDKSASKYDNMSQQSSFSPSISSYPRIHKSYNSKKQMYIKGNSSRNLSANRFNESVTTSVLSSNSGTSDNNSTTCDPSLRISTILKTWNSHRERRKSANDACDESVYLSSSSSPFSAKELPDW